MGLLDIFRKTKEPEKSKDMSHWRIYEAIVSIAKDNDCSVLLAKHSGYIRVPIKHRHEVLNNASYCEFPDHPYLSGIIGVGIPISFSEEAYAIEYVANDEKLKNDDDLPIAIFGSKAF